MLTQTITYNTSTNFTFDSDLITVSTVLKSSLVDSPGKILAETFDTSTGFTFVTATAEFVGGQFQSVDNLNGATLAVPFTDGATGTSGTGDLEGTLLNNATVTGGRLDASGGLTKHLTYDATGKINAAKGSIEFVWTPNYSVPASTSTIFKFAETSTSTNNQLFIYHDTASALRITSNRSTGTSIHSGVPFGTLFVTVGASYDFSYNWNYVDGVHQLFINGTQQGSTLASSGGRSDDTTSITYLSIANDVYSDAYYDNVITYTEPQHTAAYTSGITIPAYRYLESYAQSPLESTDGSPDGTLVSVDSWVVTGDGSTQFTFNTPAGVAYWYDGAGWTLSSQTYATSNTPAEIIANIISFPFPPNTTEFRYGIVLSDSNTLRYISDLDITYTHQFYSTVPGSCIVNSGVITDQLCCFTQTGATIPAGSTQKFVLNIDGVDQWYDGNGWTVSSGYTEANDYTTVAANIEDVSFSDGENVKVKNWLTSTGTLSSSLVSVSMGYNFAHEAESVTTCVIYGTVGDLAAQGLSSATITASSRDTIVTNNNFLRKSVAATTNTDGEFDISLAETETISKTMDIEIKITDLDGKVKKQKYRSLTIPNQTTAKLEDII